MSVHVYPAPAIAGDYLRAGAGFCLAGLPLIALETAAAVTVLLAACAVVFALHGAWTISRHLARIEISEDGIRSRGLTAAEIRWRDLQKLQLAHYSTRRDRSGGWLQLRLIGNGQRLSIDSHLQNFTAVTRRALVAARENRIPLDPATVSNLDALGMTWTASPPSARSVCG